MKEIEGIMVGKTITIKREIHDVYDILHNLVEVISQAEDAAPYRKDLVMTTEELIIEKWENVMYGVHLPAKIRNKDNLILVIRKIKELAAFIVMPELRITE